MRKYFSEETGRKLRAVGRLAAHFVPGYSTIRARRLFKESDEVHSQKRITETNYKSSRGALLSCAACDITGSAYFVFSAVYGALPTVFFGAALKLMPGMLEAGVRYEWERRSPEEANLGGNGGSAPQSRGEAQLPEYIRTDSVPQKAKLVKANT